MLLHRAQRACEDSSRGARELALQFDISMSTQRDIIYKIRDQIIEKGTAIPSDKITLIANAVFDELLQKKSGNLHDHLVRFIFDNLDYRLPDGFEQLNLADARACKQFLMKTFQDKLQTKQTRLADDKVYTKFQNLVFLKAVDEAWIEQVDFLEQLKTVVLDRHVAQHKIEFEYRREAYYAYEQMKKSMYLEFIRLLCLSEIITKDDGAMAVHFA